MKKKNNITKRGSSRKALRKQRRKPLSRLESLETRSLLAADLNTWHNSELPGDVNADGALNDLDQQIIMEELVTGGFRQLNSSATSSILEAEQSLFLDVNNDSSISSLDYLMIGELLEAEAEANFTTAFRFELRDVNDNVITEDSPGNYTVAEGDVFRLVAFVQDTSDNGQSDNQSGFLQAFLDVDINSTSNYSIFNNSVVVGIDNTASTADYFQAEQIVNATLLETNIVPDDPNGLGQTDTLIGMGGTTGEAFLTNPLGDLNARNGDDFQLFSLDFIANTTGQIELSGRAADSVASGVNAEAGLVGPALLANHFGIITPGAGDILMDSSVDYAGTNITITVEDEFFPDAVNARGDNYSVNEDLEESNTMATPIVQYMGENYLLMNVLENDTDPEANDLNSPPSTEGTTLSDTVVPLGGTSNDIVNRVMKVTLTELTIDQGRPIEDIDGNVLTGLFNEFYLYQPEENLVGSETFGYTLTEIADTTNNDTATVVVNLAAFNDPPVAVDDGVQDPDFPDLPVVLIEVLPGETISIDVLANDFLRGSNDENEVLTLVDLDFTNSQLGADQRIFINVNTMQIDYTAPLTPGTEEFSYIVADNDPNLVDDVETAMARVVVRTIPNTLASGRFYFDVNGNGQWDDNADNDASPEQFIGGVTVELLDGQNNVVETTKTDAHGVYTFAGFDAGNYTIFLNQTEVDFIVGNKFSVEYTEVFGNDTQRTNLDSLGIRGRAAGYRGFGDYIASDTEDSIIFAITKDDAGNVETNQDGSAHLSWFSVDQGWESLVSIETIFYSAETTSGFAIFNVLPPGETDPIQITQSFSPSTPGFIKIAETDDGIILRLNGNESEVLSQLDEAFAQF